MDFDVGFGPVESWNHGTLGREARGTTPTRPNEMLPADILRQHSRAADKCGVGSGCWKA